MQRSLTKLKRLRRDFIARYYDRIEARNFASSQREQRRKEELEKNSRSTKLAESLLKAYTNTGLNGKAARMSPEGRDAKYVAGVLEDDFESFIKELGEYVKNYKISNLYFFPADNDRFSSDAVKSFQNALSELVSKTEAPPTRDKESSRRFRGGRRADEREMTASRLVREYLGRIPADYRRVCRVLNKFAQGADDDGNAKTSSRSYQRMIEDLVKKSGIDFETK